MDFQLKAHLFCRIQVVLGIFNIENALLTEDIGKLGQIFCFYLRHYFFNHHVDEFTLFALVLGKHAVRPKEGGDNVDRMDFVQFFHGAQLL